MDSQGSTSNVTLCTKCWSLSGKTFRSITKKIRFLQKYMILRQNDNDIKAFPSFPSFPRSSSLWEILGNALISRIEYFCTDCEGIFAAKTIFRLLQLLFEDSSWSMRKKLWQYMTYDVGSYDGDSHSTCIIARTRGWLALVELFWCMSDFFERPCSKKVWCHKS